MPCTSAAVAIKLNPEVSSTRTFTVVRPGSSPAARWRVSAAVQRMMVHQASDSRQIPPATHAPIATILQENRGAVTATTAAATATEMPNLASARGGPGAREERERTPQDSACCPSLTSESPAGSSY